MYNRTVKISVRDDADFSIHDKELSAVIGYLATWAIQSEVIRHVDILINGPEHRQMYVDAVYRDGAGIATYQIGAIRDDDGTFSTHS